MQQRRYHILVAQEDERALHETVNLLKRRDYVVAGAPTPEEAQWWLSGWPVDLAVTSPTFGGSSGIQLILGARSNQPEVAGLIVGAEEQLPDRFDLRRHGLNAVAAPINPDEFLASVAECLAGIRRRQRWPRKEITAPVPMRIGETAGKLMDVSYGGLKFELTDEPYVLRSPVQIDFPRADLRLSAEVVWSARRANGRACVFGAAVTPDPAPAAEWRAFVDRID
jgi:DNA-binding response OmpR family regulator